MYRTYGLKDNERLLHTPFSFDFRLLMYVILFVLCIDVLGAIAWELTSQTPPDKFHIGIISESIIKIIK